MRCIFWICVRVDVNSSDKSEKITWSTSSYQKLSISSDCASIDVVNTESTSVQVSFRCLFIVHC